jgi:NAD(P)-dependent dehydrogenase (short-subunit alcohol dehydrogenase family)
LLTLKDRTAVVTGAASGIGRAIAGSLARRGTHLALADIDDAALADVAAAIVAESGRDKLRISRHHLDVADRDAVADFPSQVRRTHSGVDLLVNNAGVALGGTFDQVTEENFEWLFDINFWGVVRMTRAFLPLLQESSEARIVNLSSVFGIIAPPGNTAYAASKFAVRGFSESLRNELRKTNIGITVVHPGGIATSIVKNARMPKTNSPDEDEARRKSFEAFLKMSPERAGETIVRAVEARKARVLVGADAKRMALIERLMPVSYWNVLGRMIKGPSKPQ